MGQKFLYGINWFIFKISVFLLTLHVLRKRSDIILQDQFSMSESYLYWHVIVITELKSFMLSNIQKQWRKSEFVLAVYNNLSYATHVL